MFRMPALSEVLVVVDKGRDFVRSAVRSFGDLFLHTSNEGRSTEVVAGFGA